MEFRQYDERNIRVMIKKIKLDKNLVGIAGVYYTAAKLTHMGYVALVTTRNTKAYDLLVFKQGERKVLPIQVKTRSSGGFRVVGIDDIKTINRELIKKITCPYVLVDLKEEYPDFYILSTNQMRELVKKDWNFWEHNHTHRKPVRKTKVQIIFQLRETMNLLNDYKNKWENLHLS